MRVSRYYLLALAFCTISCQTKTIPEPKAVQLSTVNDRQQIWRGIMMREMDRINKRKAYDERTLWLVEVMLDTNDRLIHGKAVAILHTMSEVSPEKSEDVDLYMSKIVAHEPDSGVKAVLTKEWDRMKKRR